MSRGELPEGWRRIWIVALREIRERGGARSYRISTVVAILLVIAVVVIPSLVESSKTYRVGFTGPVPEGTVAALALQVKAVDHQLETKRYASLADGERAVRDKKIDVLVVDAARLEWRSSTNSTLTAAIANAVQAVHVREQADRLGISTEQLGQLLVPVTLTSRTIGVAHTSNQDANTVGLIAVGALFVAVSFYAGFLLTGVVQEKSNRVSEVLLARMPAREVLAGKVLGIGVVGLAQFAAMAAAAGITVQVMNDADVPDIPVGVLAWAVLWFVLGYFFYSVVYAALGATVSRVEDAQAATAPVTAMLLLAYLAVIYTEENPDATATVLLSHLPPTAPMVMTYRVALGGVPAWQLVSTTAFVVLCIWGIIRVAGRMYSGAVLRFGGRVPLRELWRRTARS